MNEQVADPRKRDEDEHEHGRRIDVYVNDKEVHPEPLAGTYTVPQLYELFKVAAGQTLWFVSGQTKVELTDPNQSFELEDDMRFITLPGGGVSGWHRRLSH